MIFTFIGRPFAAQRELLTALHDGLAVHGDNLGDEGDAIIIYGIGGPSREKFDAARALGKSVVFFDKGYTRRPYVRVAVNEFQPLEWIARHWYPSDRLERLRLDLKPLQPRGEHILFDGASHKYCLWHGLGNWEVWRANTVKRIERHTKRPVIQRIRPNAEQLSTPLAEDFDRTFCVVSHGGNLGFEAVVEGLPHFAIGCSIARPVSEVSWNRLDDPRIPTEEERWQWLSNVAYCQWTFDEIRSGEAWSEIRKQL